MTELLDVLDENYGEEDSKNRNDRNALELVLYPPVHEDDIDSVGDSASDNDVEPSEVLSRLSRTLLNTDAELHDKAVTAVRGPVQSLLSHQEPCDAPTRSEGQETKDLRNDEG